MTTATRPEQTPLAETATASVGDLIQRRRPLVLIGMMGAGKTRLGRQLSCLMGLPFHDSDHIIEREVGMPIPDYFARHGEPAFRKIEADVIRKLLKQGTSILAPGGGAFMNDTLRTDLLQHADCLFLDVPQAELWSRVRKRIAARPMLNQPDPKATFDALYHARRPIYQQATLRVAWQNEHLMDTLLRIRDTFIDHLKKSP